MSVWNNTKWKMLKTCRVHKRYYVYVVLLTEEDCDIFLYYQQKYNRSSHKTDS